jgi:hypothetical protein
MTHKESEQYRLNLTEIIKRLPKEVGKELLEGLKEDLLDLAREVGACTRSVHIKDNGKRDIYNASTEDLISNIHQALNTASTIEMCRISARNFWVAVIASTVAFVSVLIGSAISFLGMVATWVAVLAK